MNADKVSPEVQIALGGKIWDLVYTTKVAIKIEKATGINSLDINALLSNVSVTRLTAMMWAFISEKDQKITLDQVSEWMEFSKYAEIGGCITKAIINAFPEAKKAAEEAEENAPKNE